MLELGGPDGRTMVALLRSLVAQGVKAFRDAGPEARHMPDGPSQFEFDVSSATGDE